MGLVEAVAGGRDTVPVGTVPSFVGKDDKYGLVDFGGGEVSIGVGGEADSRRYSDAGALGYGLRCGEACSGKDV